MVFKLSGLVVTVGNDMVSRHVAGWGQFYVYLPFAQFCQLDKRLTVFRKGSGRAGFGLLRIRVVISHVGFLRARHALCNGPYTKDPTV